MTCQDARELFSALIDEALAADELGVLDAHLLSCAECRRELERFRQTMAVLHAVRPARAPAGFVDRVLGAARPTPWHRRLAKRLFWPLRVKLPLEAAAVALVAVTAVYVFQHSPELQEAGRQQAPPPVVSDRPLAPPPAAEQLSRKVAPKAERAAVEKKVDVSPARSSGEGKPAEGKPPEASPAPAAPAPPAAGIAQPAPPGTKSAPALERRMDALREQGMAAPGARSEVAKQQAAPTASAVSGRLTVGDREAALRAVTELLQRVGASEISRRSEGAVTVIEIDLAREAYADLARGLSSIGRWAPEAEPAETVARVALTLRLIE